MAKLVTYRCPECKGVFDFLHHPADEPPPDRCELCHAWMGDEPEKAPVLHLKIGTAKNKVPDKVFRDMEQASIERAEDAAAMTGGSSSEFSNMKITNLKDNTRAGDISAMSVHAAEKELTVSAHGHTIKPEMQNPNASRPANQQVSPEVQGWIDDATTGPSAGTGAATLNNIRQFAGPRHRPQPLAAK